MPIKKTSLIFTFILFSVLLLNQIALADFGVSPPFVENKHLLAGSYFEREIFLVRSQAAQALPMTVIFSPELAEIRSWFEIEPGLDFVIPAEVRQFPLKIKIQVPRDTQLGKYSGYIWIEGKLSGDQKEQVRTMVGGTISVNLTVTDKEYSDWQLRDLRLGHLAEGEKVLKVYLKVENLGNVRVRPSKVGLKVYDNYHQDLLFFNENTDLEWVEPFETREIAAEYLVDLENHQQYWAEIEVYKEGELLLTDERRLNVGEIPTKEVSSGQVSEPSEKSETNLEFEFLKSKIFLFSLLGIVLAVALGFGIRQIRKSGIRLEIKKRRKLKRGKLLS